VARAVLYVGDQQPSLPTTVKDSAGNVVNLTGYTGVTFALRQAYDTANDLTTGIVPGVYEGQWTLADASSKPQHVDAGQFEIRKGF
jgi:hypothetical protein